MAFNAAAYLAANPDVASAYATESYGLTQDEFAQAHYDVYGKPGGIDPRPLAPTPAATPDGIVERQRAGTHKNIAGQDVTNTQQWVDQQRGPLTVDPRNAGPVGRAADRSPRSQGAITSGQPGPYAGQRTPPQPGFPNGIPLDPFTGKPTHGPGSGNELSYHTGMFDNIQERHRADQAARDARQAAADAEYNSPQNLAKRRYSDLIRISGNPNNTGYAEALAQLQSIQANGGYKPKFGLDGNVIELGQREPEYQDKNALHRKTQQMIQQRMPSADNQGRSTGVMSGAMNTAPKPATLGGGAIAAANPNGTGVFKSLQPAVTDPLTGLIAPKL